MGEGGDVGVAMWDVVGGVWSVEEGGVEKEGRCKKDSLECMYVCMYMYVSSFV